MKITYWPEMSGLASVLKDRLIHFGFHVKHILNYISNMFEEGFKYSTICCDRSAIFAFHETVDERSVGEDPQVSALISGVFNERHP